MRSKVAPDDARPAVAEARSAKPHQARGVGRAHHRLTPTAQSPERSTRSRAPGSAHEITKVSAARRRSA